MRHTVLMAALLHAAAAEPVRVVGTLKDADKPDAAQHLYAFLRSAAYGSVHVGRRARAEIDAVIKLDAPAPPELTRVAALFPWCALTQDASKAGRGVVASMRGVVAPVRGVVSCVSLVGSASRTARPTQFQGPIERQGARTGARIWATARPV